MITKSSLLTLASIASLPKTRGLAVLNRYTFLTSTASSMMGVFGTGYEGSSPSADGGWSVCENGDGKCDANAKVSSSSSSSSDVNCTDVPFIKAMYARAFMDFERYVRVHCICDSCICVYGCLILRVCFSLCLM